jgi:hypothetical protein
MKTEFQLFLNRLPRDDNGKDCILKLIDIDISHCDIVCDMIMDFIKAEGWLESDERFRQRLIDEQWVY